MTQIYLTNGYAWSSVKGLNNPFWCLKAFTFGFVKKYIFYTLKDYFIYFTNSFNNTPNIQIIIFTYNPIK